MGFLPYNGSDSAAQRKQENPWQSRTHIKQHEGFYKTGTNPPTWEQLNLYSLMEAKYSRNHPVSYLGRSHTNIGGRFVHTRVNVDQWGKKVDLFRTGSPSRYGKGMVAASANFISDLYPAANALTPEDVVLRATPLAPLGDTPSLNALGTTAIARVAPTNPLVDLSSSVAELMREGLPQTPGNAGNIGGEYLNVMFGYLPLYGDATDLVRVARDSDALLAQYERDSGRWIRRRYQFETTVTSSVQETANAVPVALGFSPSGLFATGKRVTRQTTTTRTWFSGAFTYHLPRNGWRRSAAELDHLYGVVPGLDTVWELTGYSWLVDYFSNVGDVMKNITAFEQDGLVMPYGYIMQEVKLEHEETWQGGLYVGGSLQPSVIVSRKTYLSQQRLPATPFGFGLELDGLSTRQLSILAALGISRL
jgi:hypothetical protein